MSTETTNKKIKIDNGTTFGKTYTDKAIDERLQGLVSTATFTPVKEKANNSLQKPAGLTKTKLVGVGTNGQENIEIGDNLTLANGKLSAIGGGSGGDVFDVITPSADGTTYTGTITGTKPILYNDGESFTLFSQVIDKNGGNPVANLCLSSSATSSSFITLQNGKVTNEDSQLYHHFITITSNLVNINFNYYNTDNDVYTINSLKIILIDKFVSCSGFVDDGGTKEIAMYISGDSKGEKLTIGWFDLSDGSTGGTTIDNTTSVVSDIVTEVN